MEVAYFGEFIFILPIFGYAILGELALYAVILMSVEEATSDTGNETCDQEKTLDLETGEFKVKPRPIVRNPFVWRVCKKLGIDAKLEFPQGAKIMVVNGVPFVNSKEVYMFCQALKLEADMLL
ncbi:hypothetical protein AVEN_228114-1 [Araneus ventricosus]|uniref:Uncharacterized protein n=1 Tax=Araneus ventricosus TaxID=182803 RepID=A0A4Y2UWN2_ARAVE|nr:hypothetical protein AVEN_166541-1 [Araneus ventricosus]GBO16010.1 hypothetical protein AVEN_228114-1 [Araneus ventricosus]